MGSGNWSVVANPCSIHQRHIGLHMTLQVETVSPILNKVGSNNNHLSSTSET